MGFLDLFSGGDSERAVEGAGGAGGAGELAEGGVEGAGGVMAGDVEAYIKMVTLTDKSIGIQAYNGNAVYPGLIRPHLNAALGDAKLTAQP